MPSTEKPSNRKPVRVTSAGMCAQRASRDRLSTGAAIRSWPSVRARPRRPACCLTIRWPSEANPEMVRELQRIWKPFTRGRCEVSIEYRRNGAEAALTLSEARSVRVTRDLRDQLTRLLGDDSYLIHYPRHFV